MESLNSIAKRARISRAVMERDLTHPKQLEVGEKAGSQYIDLPQSPFGGHRFTGRPTKQRINRWKYLITRRKLVLYRLKKKKKKDILIWTSHLLYENSYVAYAISQIEYPVQVSTTSQINIVEPICYTCCLITRVLCTNTMRLLDPSTFGRAQNYASLHPTLIPGQFVDRKQGMNSRSLLLTFPSFFVSALQLSKPPNNRSSELKLRQVYWNFFSPSLLPLPLLKPQPELLNWFYSVFDRVRVDDDVSKDFFQRPPHRLVFLWEKAHMIENSWAYRPA